MRTLRLLALALFVAAAAILVFVFVRQPPSASEGAARAGRELPRGERSVLVVTVDTTRPDRLEPYGADNVETPVLSRLAQRGIVFENASAVAPITLVAHTSILSGLYPFEHGVRNNGLQYVSESVTTLAERLQAEDYRTAAFVSAAVLDQRYGLDQGFEVYDDDLSQRRNVSPRMVADRPAEYTVAAAAAWLDGLDEDENFFAWVHFYDPHASYSPPPPYRDEYRERLYDGEIAYMDAQLGELLSHPRLLGGWGATQGEGGGEPPIVMVIGDHGESLGEHGERTHAILAYDSTLHVPWVLHVPGGPSGLRISEHVGQVDLMPTVLSLLELAPAQGLAGRDLVPLIEGRVDEPERPYYSETYLPFYTYGWAKLRVMRRGRWKLIDAPAPELYDLVRDPRELTDQHGQESGLTHDLKRDLDEWLEASGDGDREASLSLDSEALAQLRSLGYASVGSGRQDDGSERPNPMEMIEQHVGLERARTFLADRLYDQAVRQLEGVLRRDPQNLAALIDLVRAHEGLGNIEEALRLAERALTLDPEYTQTYMMLARLEAQHDDLPKAIELVDLAIGRDPQHPDLRIQKASFLQRLGRLDEARDVLAESLTQNPEHPRTNAVYAHMVEARLGEVEAAERRLVQALENDPYLDQGWLFLGRIQERGQRFDDALTSLRRGLQSRADDADLHGAIGHLQARLRQHEEAVVHLREAIRLSPQPRSELYVSLGGVLAELGRLEEARLEYDKVLALEPKHPGARNNAAIALYRSGRTEDAEAMLNQVVADFPRLADAHNNLAAIAVDQQQWQDVIRHSRRTLELAPTAVEAWNNLGIGLEETGQVDEAREAYEKALDIDAEYWPGFFNLGLLLKKTGATREAVTAFNEVLTRVPNHAEAHLELGELYSEALVDLAQARVHWNAFLRHAPAHPRGGEIRQRLAAL